MKIDEIGGGIEMAGWKDSLLHRLIVRTPRKVVGEIIASFYFFMQFLLPLIFIFNLRLAALVFFSAFPLTIAVFFVVRSVRLAAQRFPDRADSSYQSQDLLASASGSQSEPRQVTQAYVDALDWQQFEQIVGDVYRKGGYRVEQRGGRNPDGGVDLVLHSDRGRVLVQCKHWKVYKVGVKPVRELFGVMVSEKAIGAILVTVGEFTQEAKDWAAGKQLFLVNGSAFIAQANRVDAERYVSFDQLAWQSNESAAPACPICRQSMLLKKARRGPNSGSQFWGCSRYPHCRGIRKI
ncbi:MAG: restriction endonuclease [Janthinobacterium lividum]